MESIASPGNFRLHYVIPRLRPSPVPRDTQFRFQIHLNRPTITSNVTIVFTKEDDLNSEQARNFEEHSQEVRILDFWRGHEKKLNDDGQSSIHSRMHGGEAQKGDI